MGLGGLYGLSRDALLANGYALQVTGQNVSNVNSPGYARRVAKLETGNSGDGGVIARGLERITDRFADSRFYNANGFSSGSEARSSALGGVDELFADVSGTGLGDSMGAFFSSFSELSVNPSDKTLRSHVLDTAATMTERFRTTSTQLNSIRDELKTRAQDAVAQINALAKDLAVLNGKIQTATATGGDGADLQDQRDRLIEDLSGYINVDTFTDNSGRFVIRGGGATLVEASSASTLTAVPDVAGNLQYSLLSGSVTMNITNLVTGGTLAGLRQARDTDVKTALTSLDQLALDLGTAINTQHAAGFGLDGVTGRNFFQLAGAATAGTMVVDPAMVGQPDRVGAASSAGTLPGGSDNAIELFKISDKKVINGATRTPAEGYGDLIGDVGMRKQAADREATTRSAMTDQTKSLRESARGVSMDEEMVSLSRYQRAYEAASKLLQTVDSLIEGLIRDV